MSQVTEKELKQYFRQIRLLMPVFGREEKQFLRDLRESVADFMEANPGCSLEQIEERFGEPKEIAADYLSNAATLGLCKKISIRKYIRRGIALIMVLALLTFGIYNGLLYKLYLHEKSQVIAHEETIIE